MQRSQRKIAWILLLVLLMGLGIVCCAYASGHECSEEESCACPICLYVQCLTKLTFVALIVAIAIVGALFHAFNRGAHVPFIIPLVFQKIRLND